MAPDRVLMFEDPRDNPDGLNYTEVPLYDSRSAAEAAHAEAWGHVDHPIPPFGAFLPDPEPVPA